MLSDIFYLINILIKWCNYNQGFLSFVLTSIALLTIIVTGLLMRKSNKLSQENLSQAILLETQRSRPRLIISIEHNDIRAKDDRDRWWESFYYAHLTVKNIGLTPAYDVKITSSPELIGVQGDGERVSGLLNNIISMIAPGQEMSDCLCPSEKFNEIYKQNRFEFNLKYKDLFSNDCGHIFFLDLDYTDNVYSSYISFSKGESIEEKIHKALLNIDMTLSSIASNSNILARPNNDLLDEPQKKLLLELISAHESVPKDETHIFLVSAYIQNKKPDQYQIYHDGFVDHKYLIEFDKLLSLERMGCIARVPSTMAHNSCSFTFFITPAGFKYGDKIGNKS
jgi:hypothetical protein